MLKKEIHIQVEGQNLILLQERAVYWQEQNTLLIADLHAGKATHFRNNGIPLSSDHLLKDFNAILSAIKRLSASKLIFLGDLYHTTSNIENELIDSWLGELTIDVELIIGNHDIHSIHTSKLAHRMPYVLDNILLSHEPQESKYFNIYGHLHPTFSLTGKGRQHLKFPCFYHGKKHLVLPAFGSVNGGKTYKKLVSKSDVYLVSSEGIIAI